MYKQPPRQCEYVHIFNAPDGTGIAQAIVTVHDSSSGNAAHAAAMLTGSDGRVRMRVRFTLQEDGTLFADYWSPACREWRHMTCNGMHTSDAIAALDDDSPAQWLVECLQDAVVASPVCC